MNRPEVRNALNLEMIRELTEAYHTANTIETINYVILEGTGESFSAGADIKWMKASAGLSYDENVVEAKVLATLFSAIYQTQKITIARVHGNVFGGGNGLVAANDIVFAATSSRFAFSETRLGIIPATILPYVQLRIGEQHAKVTMLTAKPFDTGEAHRIGLVDYNVPLNDMNAFEEKLLNDLSGSSPEAQLRLKNFQRKLNRNLPVDMIELTATAIAESRISAEGQEGLHAFLEKRKPNWN